MLKKLLIHTSSQSDYPSVVLGKEKDTMSIHAEQVNDLLKRVVQKEIFDEINGNMFFTCAEQIDSSPTKNQSVISAFLKNTFNCIKAGGILNLLIENQSDCEKYKNSMKKNGFNSIQVKKYGVAVQVYGQKPAPDKKKNSKLNKLGKSELTLKTPLPMVYRVKSSLQELQSARLPQFASSDQIERVDLKANGGGTPNHVHESIQLPAKGEDLKVQSRKLSNSIINQLNQVSFKPKQKSQDNLEFPSDIKRYKSAMTMSQLQQQTVNNISQDLQKQTQDPKLETEVKTITDDKVLEPSQNTQARDKVLPTKKLSTATLLSRNQRHGVLHFKIDKQFFEIIDGSDLEDNAFHSQISEQVVFQNDKVADIDQEQVDTAHTFIYQVLQNMRKIRTLTFRNFVFLNIKKKKLAQHYGHNSIRVLNLLDCNTMLLVLSLKNYIQNIEEINIESQFQDLNWNLREFKKLKKLKLIGDSADLEQIFGGLEKAYNPVYMAVTLNIREGAVTYDWLMRNMSCLKFKQILLYVKTLRVTPNDNLKNHEFEMNDKIKVQHELHKREDADIITLTYKKTMGESIQKIVIQTSRIVEFTPINQD